MIRAFSLAFAQLLDPRIVRVVVLSVVITLAVYAALIGGLIYGLAHVHLASVPWLDQLARWGSGVGAVLLAALLFPGAVTAVMAAWQDRIADAVEARYYPDLPPPRELTVGETVGAALRLLGLTVVINLALLPLYLALLFVPPLNAVVFALANGAVLGREYFEAAAFRHMPPAQARELRRARRGTVLLAGTAAAFLLSIPGLNLIAPVLATAAFVHLVQGLHARTLSYSKN